MADYDLGTARGRIDIDASGAKKGVDSAKKASGELEESTKDVGSSATTAGLALTGFGVAALAAFGVAVKASADFEKQMSAFKAVSRATAEQMDAIREKALQLGADTKFSASEAASAMEELAKQGLSVEDIMNGAADATVALAAAGEIELAQAASISAAALNQFKLNAQDLPHVADLLAGAANASATGVTEIGHALTYVGSVAKTVGLSIDDTAGAIALLANNGIDASKAGTVLRSILTDLSPTTKKANAAMRDLGIITKDGKNQFFDATGKVKSFSDIVDILNKSTKNLTNQQKINTLQTIFGTEALAGISAIAGTTKDEFDELAEAIGDVKAADVAADRMDNLAGSMEALSGSIETVLIKAGSQFQVGLKGIVDALTGVINFLGDLNPEIQKWIGYLVAGAGATALFVGGLLLFVDALQKAKVAFAALNVVITNNPFVRAVLIIAAVAAAIFTAYKNVQWFRDAVDKLWDRFQPVWDGIKDKVGSVANFISNTVVPRISQAWDRITETAGKVGGAIRDALGPKLAVVWENIQSAGQRVSDWFTNTLVPALSRVKEAIGEAFSEKIAPAFLAAVRTIRDRAAEVRDWFVTNFGPAFSTVWRQIQDGASGLRDWFGSDFVPALQGVFNDKIKPAWESFLSWIDTTVMPKMEELVRSIGDAIGSVADTVRTKLEEVSGSAASGDLGSGIADKIKGAWQSVVDFFTNTVGPGIQTFVSGALEQWGLFTAWLQTHVGPVLVALSELWNAIWNKMGEIVPAVLDVIKVIIGVFVGFVLLIWNTFGNDIINAWLIIWDGIKGVVEGALQIIRGIINVLTGLISGDWGKVWEGIVNITQGIWNVIWAVVSTALEAMWNVVRAILNAIWGFIVGIWNAIVDKTVETWNNFKNSISNKVNEVFDTIRTIGSRIWDILSSINLYEIGSRIIRGLIDGVRSALGGLYDLFSGITDKIPKIKGPMTKDAKLLTPNGEAIMQGFMEGIQQGWKQVEGLLVGVTNEIAPTVGSTTTTNSTTINVNFGDVHGASGQAVAATLSDNNLLRQITNAARAGVGKRN